MRKEDKMKKTNKIVATLLALGMVSTSMTSLAADDIKIFVDDKQLECPVNPIIENERTLVPMRAIFEALGAKVDWDGDKQEITVKKGGDKVVMYLDSDVAYINDTPITLDAPATLMNNRTMVPLRFVMEAFNVTVDWNGDTRTVEITK